MFYQEKIQLNLLYKMSIFGVIKKSLEIVFKQARISVIN